MRKLLGQIFTAAGDFEIAFARDGVEALAVIGEFKPDVVTLDIHMPLMDGLTCLDRIMLEHPCPVVLVSSLTEEGAEETLTALAIGAVDFIAKPDGAISLNIEKLAPRLVDKVRMASTVRLKRSHRLVERLRLARAPASGSKAAPRLYAPAAKSVPSNGVVIVGTSTGGPPALDALLSGLPANFPWPIVVAQHMPATFTGALARRLDRICALGVTEVLGPVPLAAGQVYIGRGDADIIISPRGGGIIAMSAPSDPELRWHPSVERLVRTAMKHLNPDQLIGVLMTGMGNDGASAMTELRLAGGHTIAESEESAVVWGMPGELVRMAGASDILPVESIGTRLVEILS